MKKRSNFVALSLVFLSLSSYCTQERYLIDTCKIVVYGDKQTDIITLSDTQRPSLDGSARSEEDLVLESLMKQLAAEMGLKKSEEDIDRYLQAVQRQHNLTMDDMKSIFRHAGYTFEEGREQFGIMSAINGVIDFKIRSRLIVPEKDIVAYYEANPEYKDETVQLARTFVLFDDQNNDDIRNEVERVIAAGEGPSIFEWSEPFWLLANDLAEDKKYILKMKPSDIVVSQEDDEGIELLMLMDKQESELVPLEDRYRSIADTLKGAKYGELFQQFSKELLDNAIIVYF